MPGQVYLADCQHLVRRGLVGLPGGFTKSGNPLLIFPDRAATGAVSEGDLHLLLKYFISVVPRADQVRMMIHQIYGDEDSLSREYGRHI